MESPEHAAGGDAPEPHTPQHQVYFVTVEWLETSHRPESPERLAQLIRHAIEHGHDHGPNMVPAPFTVRVKAGDTSAEVSGTVVHRHHQAIPPQPPAAE